MIKSITPTVIASIGSKPYLTTIKWNNGEIIADEPLGQGGSGNYPDPFSLLASSLAACSLITLRIYGERKEWNITDIKVSITISQERDGIENQTAFTKSFEYEPAVTEEQRDRLALIASKCPIAKTLSGQIQFLTI